MNKFISTKVIELGSSAFRQWRATHSHCQFVHGYQLKAKFWFGCTELDNKNWAADFGDLKDLKQELQRTFDHKLLIAADDPLLPEFKALEQKGAVLLSIFEEGVGIERAAEHCFRTASKFIREKYGNRVWVSKVEVFEHEDNSAIYESSQKYEKYFKQVQTMIDYAVGNKDEDQPLDQLPVRDTQTQTPQSYTPQPASITQQVTQGPGNWFAGSSWG